MCTAAYREKGFMVPAEGKGSWKDKDNWREANRRRQSTQASCSPPPRLPWCIHQRL